MEKMQRQFKAEIEQQVNAKFKKMRIGRMRSSLLIRLPSAVGVSAPAPLNLRSFPASTGGGWWKARMAFT